MRRALSPLLVLALGCQEYTIDQTKDPPVDEPIDTDVAAPIAPGDIEVSPALLEFGALSTECPPISKVFTITNAGEGNLDIETIEVVGPDGAVYSILDHEPFRLRPGRTWDVEVTFAPTARVPYTQAGVRIASNDPDEPSVRVDTTGEGSDVTVREDLFQQVIANDVVDVLFVVDNSESMADQIDALGAEMDTFFQQFVLLGLDFHLGVTTMDMSSTGQQGRLLGQVITPTTPNAAAEFRRQVDNGAAGSSSERGMTASKSALSPPRIHEAPNDTFLRSHANLAIVVMSDEDDGDANPEGLRQPGNDQVTDRYLAWLWSLKPDPRQITFNGLVGPRTGGVAACGLFGPSVTQAPQYHRAIAATDGVWSNMCNLDVVTFLDALALTIAGLDAEFDLSGQPADPTCAGLEVTVDGQVAPCDPRNGWTYDPVENSVQMHGSWMPDEGAWVRVVYEVADTCD